MDEALQVKQAVEGELLQKKGVTGIDVGQRAQGAAGSEPVIRIYVADRAEAMRSQDLPTEIQGVPVEVVERRFTLH
jgi:hypothetical protein